MYSKYIKRVIDVLFSVVLLILLSPIFLVVAVAIKLDSKGPVIFKQIRSGKNGVPFKLYKFRSMSASNDVYNSSEEDQVTKVGRVIRKLSLDELPQLINIIKGDMSFIGPRPWILEYAENFNKHQMRRLDVLPGITGLAQCSGRNNLSIKERINIDIYYVKHVSFKMDVMISLKTIKCIVKREGFSNSKSAIHDEIKALYKQNNPKRKEYYKFNYKDMKKKKKVTSDTMPNLSEELDDSLLVGSGAWGCNIMYPLILNLYSKYSWGSDIIKILVVCQYYYPEPVRITDICEELVKQGNEITVLTGVPNYPMGNIYNGYKLFNNKDEVINGVKIKRCFTIPRKKGKVTRLLNYISFPLSSASKIRKLEKDFDIVLVNQLSPVIMANAGIKYKKKNNIKLVLYCLDLWPESLLVGGVSKKSILYKFFYKLSEKIYSSDSCAP